MSASRVPCYQAVPAAADVESRPFAYEELPSSHGLCSATAEEITFRLPRTRKAFAIFSLVSLAVVGAVVFTAYASNGNGHRSLLKGNVMLAPRSSLMATSNNNKQNEDDGRIKVTSEAKQGKASTTTTSGSSTGESGDAEYDNAKLLMKLTQCNNVYKCLHSESYMTGETLTCCTSAADCSDYYCGSTTPQHTDHGLWWVYMCTWAADDKNDC